MATISAILAGKKLQQLSPQNINRLQRTGLRVYLEGMGLDLHLIPYVDYLIATSDGVSESGLVLRHPLVVANPFREELVPVYNQLFYQRLLR